MRFFWLFAGVVGCGDGGAGDADDADDAPPADGDADTDADADADSDADADTDTDTDTDVPREPSPLELVINEVMPGNQSTIDAEGGTKPDWIEILNVGDTAVPVAGLRLLNDEGGSWTAPEAGEIAPGERLFLWADAETFGDVLSTGFNLDKDGDGLLLVDSEGRLVDELDIPAVPSDVSIARTPDGTGDFVATAWPTPREPNGDVASPTLNAADETLFLAYEMHRIDFEFTQQAYQAINQYDRPEVHVGLVIDGISYPDVGLKLKGSASYQTMDGKPAFMVDLNNWISGEKFRGLKAFKLHNGVVLDPTRSRDWLSYQLAREAGLMGARVGWAEVYCNGNYYGLYVIVEKHDDEFIEYRRPGQQDIGVMLEPNAPGAGGGWGWGDFGQGTVINWNHEEGPIPADPLTIESLQAADDLIARPPNDANVALLWDRFDKDAFLSYVAWETVVMHSDGYRGPNNWRVFVDGVTYKIELVPAGVEWTWDYDVEPWYSGGAAANWCLSNEGCRREYAERLLEVADLAEQIDLLGQYRDLQVWLGPYIDSDPRYAGEWSPYEVQDPSTRQHLRENPARARELVYQAYPDLAP